MDVGSLGAWRRRCLDPDQFGRALRCAGLQWLQSHSAQTAALRAVRILKRIARVASCDALGTAVGAGGAPTVACAVASTAIVRRCDAPLT
ncbi:hypothetical protein XFF1815_400023 [Xanthomonas citri pv. fuscans]|nr:hypothetical protein XFF6960_520171 [Xanthomonas citri pv. fuscans]SOO43782.1 hypothetical protein XFF1815_400023 [Xanthomonas citri pv. fuscans]